MSETTKCSFCGENSTCERYPSHMYRVVDCPICGEYIQQYTPFEYGKAEKDKVLSYLYHHKEKNKEKNLLPFIGTQRCYENVFDIDENVYYASFDEIEAFYPKSILERVSKVLIVLAEKSEFLGRTIRFESSELKALLFIKTTNKKGEEIADALLSDQIWAFLEYLANLLYADSKAYGTDNYHVTLKPNGWNRVYELQKNSTEFSKDVFIAMSFAEEMSGVREAIKKAVTACGFSPRIMDEIEHNHQIVPEMLYEIRQARFVIAELTGHNNGAYFEAGYALGQGKEVIQVCNKEKFGEDGHFDVKQINTVMWESEEELTEKLIARIKATVG